MLRRFGQCVALDAISSLLPGLDGRRGLSSDANAPFYLPGAAPAFTCHTASAGGDYPAWYARAGDVRRRFQAGVVPLLPCARGSRYARRDACCISISTFLPDLLPPLPYFVACSTRLAWPFPNTATSCCKEVPPAWVTGLYSPSDLSLHLFFSLPGSLQQFVAF